MDTDGTLLYYNRVNQTTQKLICSLVFGRNQPKGRTAFSAVSEFLSFPKRSLFSMLVTFGKSETGCDAFPQSCRGHSLSRQRLAILYIAREAPLTTC
jgi:hypothetical protein